MQICPNCNEEVTENFEICWNCGFSFVDGEFVSLEPQYERLSTFNCLRCNIPMQYDGNYNIRKGTGAGVFTDYFVFDVFVCPKCGKVEFFIPNL